MEKERKQNKSSTVMKNNDKILIDYGGERTTEITDSYW